MDKNITNHLYWRAAPYLRMMVTRWLLGGSPCRAYVSMTDTMNIAAYPQSIEERYTKWFQPGTVNVERFAGLNFLRFSGLLQKFSMNLSTSFLFCILNNKHFWPRQCESIFCKNLNGVESVNIWPSKCFHVYGILLLTVYLKVVILPKQSQYHQRLVR